VTVFAQTGFATKVLELTATSIGEGVVVGGFIAAAAGMRYGRSRKEMESNALRSSFWGGAWGMFCLCIDLLMKYPGSQ
jgi:hypothetical protein